MIFCSHRAHSRVIRVHPPSHQRTMNSSQRCKRTFRHVGYHPRLRDTHVARPAVQPMRPCRTHLPVLLRRLRLRPRPDARRTGHHTEVFRREALIAKRLIARRSLSGADLPSACSRSSSIAKALGPPVRFITSARSHFTRRRPIRSFGWLRIGYVSRWIRSVSNLYGETMRSNQSQSEMT